MNDDTFLQLTRNLNSIDNALVLSDLDVISYRNIKARLDATLAAAAYARLDEFYEDGEAF